MKRLFLTVLMIFLLSNISFADVTPISVTEIPSNAIGVYQVSSSRVVVYSKPSENSKVLYDEHIDYSKYLDTPISPVYCVILSKKQLSYMYATDCAEDWVEVIYNKSTGATGWVKKDDLFQFLPWVNFYGMYGRKYGLVMLKSSNKVIEKMYSQADSSSKIISENIRPVRIRLTSIEGNFALVSILDMTGSIHTGYIEWRNQDGKYFLFPEFK